MGRIQESAGRRKSEEVGRLIGCLVTRSDPISRVRPLYLLCLAKSAGLHLSLVSALILWTSLGRDSGG